MRRIRDILTERNRINKLLQNNDILNLPLDLQAEWNKYLCVLASEFVEESIRTIFEDVARSRSAPQVRDFAISQLDVFANAKVEKVFVLVGSFSSVWRSNLENAISDQVRDQVNSIVGNRHTIAHGRSINAGRLNLSQYFQSAQVFVREIGTACETRTGL